MRDEWFIRGEVPMTKSEVRAISLSKLELGPGFVLYDVGAGTGSVSIEASCFAGAGRIYAIEKNPEAIKLIKANKEKFGADAVEIIEGCAPKALENLPLPTHVFAGGTSGAMKEIFTLALEKNPKVRVVANVIALESLAGLLAFLKSRSLSAEIVQVQISRARTAGSYGSGGEYHLMTALNPVYVVSFGGEGESG